MDELKEQNSAAPFEVQILPHGAFRYRFLTSRSPRKTFTFPVEFTLGEIPAVHIYFRWKLKWDDGTEISQNEASRFLSETETRFTQSGFVVKWFEIAPMNPRDPIAIRINYLALFLTTEAGQYVENISLKEPLTDLDRALFWERGLEKFKRENPQFASNANFV
jgi:hypothetical protein